MGRIGKILCVCTVLLVGGLGARIAEARVTTIAQEAISFFDALGESAAWREVWQRLPSWRSKNDGLVFPSDQRLHPNPAASADEQESASICTILFRTVEPKVLASGSLLRRGSRDNLLEFPFPLLQNQAMARQSTDTLFSVHLTDDFNASETKRALALKGSWLAYGEATSYRMQDNNKCIYYGALKDSLARIKKIAFPLSKQNQHNSPSATRPPTNGLLTRESIDCSLQTISKFQGEHEAMLPRKIFSPNGAALLCPEVASRLNAHDIDIDDMRVAELAERIG